MKQKAKFIKIWIKGTSRNYQYIHCQTKKDNRLSMFWQHRFYLLKT